MLDHRDFGEFVGDEERVRKDGSVLAIEPVENLDREFHFHAARDIDKRARANERFVQRGKFGGAERGRLRHEMLAEKIFVFDQAALERLQDARREARSVSGKRIAPQQLIVGVDQTAGDFIQATSIARGFLARFIVRLID